jgi:hypothetical protein
MKLYIIRGVSGTGKTTYAKEIRCSDWPACDRPAHFEADMFFTDPYGNYDFDPNLLHQAHQWCQLNVLRMMRQYEPIIVSNTFTTFKEVEPYLKMADRYGYEVYVVTMEKEYGSIHNVPDEVMEKQRARFVDGETFANMVNGYFNGSV